MFASCKIEWKGLPNSYEFGAYTPGSIGFDRCCAETRQQASKDAQNAWNAQKEAFAAAVADQTSISGSFTPKCILGCSGSASKSESSSGSYDVEYGPTKWSVTADCKCLKDDFLDIQGKCDSGLCVATNGRDKDKCNIKIQCKFRAVSSSSCDGEDDKDKEEYDEEEYDEED